MPILLQVNNLTKCYDIIPLFDGLTLSVSDRQHIGVVGRNGAGKSTLFQIIMGFEPADSGEVNIHAHTRIGYIRQQVDPFDPEETVINFLMRSSGKEEWACAKLAGQFDLKHEQLTTKIGSFSGGYQMRVKVVDVLLTDPNLLLLDEPTNYLDLSTILLLEQFLQQFSGSFLLISHDREFLNKTCTSILEIAHRKSTYFPQTLEEYLAYKVQQEEFAKRYNKKIAKEQRHLQSFVDRFRYKASKASQAQSKLKQLEKLQTMEIAAPERISTIHIPLVKDKKGTALSVESLTIGYPNNVVAADVTFHIDRGERVAIVGDNGQGKSTLLKTIAGELSPISGSAMFGPHISVGYYAQHVPEMLDPKMQIESHLQAMAGPEVSDQEIFQMAGNFLFRDDDLKKPISVLSGGEKSRLCLAGLLLQKHEVLLLDESTNHLDFETVEALSEALAECNTTLLFVSHNRTFVNTVATSIITVGNGRVKRYYHDYENYVYHLKETLHIKQVVQETKSLPEQEKKAERIAVRNELKEAKKILRATEEELMELERRKQQLMDWFEKHTGTFSRVKQDELADVTHALHMAEETWFDQQKQVDELENTVSLLQ